MKKQHSTKLSLSKIRIARLNPAKPATAQDARVSIGGHCSAVDACPSFACSIPRCTTL